MARLASNMHGNTLVIDDELLESNARNAFLST